eukprot:TRINITY_DN53200_c0_g1_i1.p1 TRINITY_DN53200_c0_g1~~TRINITY_DN53200_c0_g1_i1.p1  ORF type:complete len:270 (-),score=2.31 TRINITY_DN53200_c0_g1_i1:62-871(-)
MSLPVYADLDKNTRDIFNDDFDTKCSLKVKSEAPCGATLTTNTDCCGFSSKVSGKWAHSSGFAVDKLEFAGKDKIKLESSLTGLAPGMKLEFKGASANTGNLGMTYKHKLATVTTDLDIAGFSTANASVLGGSNGVLAGASAKFALAGKFEVKDFSAGFGYQRSNMFAGVVANKKFGEFNAAFHYAVKPNLTIAALCDIVPKASSHKFNIGTEYVCNPNTTVKVKANSDGVINASVKQKFPKKFTVVGAAQVEAKNISAVNFGVTATLG